MRRRLFPTILKGRDYVIIMVNSHINAALIPVFVIVICLLLAQHPAASQDRNSDMLATASTRVPNFLSQTGIGSKLQPGKIFPGSTDIVVKKNYGKPKTFVINSIVGISTIAGIGANLGINTFTDFDELTAINSNNSFRLPVKSESTMNGQMIPVAVPPAKSRLWIVAGGHAAIWAGTFVALNRAWYRDYPRSSFHFFDDRKEWKQMDKAGHVWTAYQLSRHSAESWKWAGMSDRQSAWLGGASAFAFQSIVEILDGFSDEWGFSIGDMEANLAGSAGFIAQQLLFQQQVVQVKFGYDPYNYEQLLKPRRDKLFGASLPEQLLKDYNSQRYWLSVNLNSLAQNSKLPAWLNLAIGYSADGLFGANSNLWTDDAGNRFDRSDISRVRRFYLSPDVDLTKIKTKSKLLKSVLFVVNMIKIPAPAIEYNSNGKFRIHALLF